MENQTYYADNSQMISSTERECFICEEIPNEKKFNFRRRVCRNLPANYKFQENWYCILHFPSSEKNEQFKIELNNRLNERNYSFVGVYFPIELEFVARTYQGVIDFRWAKFLKKVEFASTSVFKKEIKFQSAKFFKQAYFDSIKFDKSVSFENVCFGDEVSFENTIFDSISNFESITFESETSFVKTSFNKSVNFKRSIFNGFADFSKAQFIEVVDFRLAKFNAEANFYEVTFIDDAFFVSVIFENVVEFSYSTFSHKNSHANFRLTNFKEDAFFRGVNFYKNAYFRAATFSKNVSFSSSTFGQNAYFTDSIFDENSRISFRSTKFQGVCDFRYATIKGNMVFEGGEQMIHKKLTGVFTVCFEIGNVWLDLRESRHIKAEKISFHRVRLQPGWFLNINAKDFVFTDIEWENVENYTTKENVKAEIKQLEERKIENSKQLFKIACRQLAENAENNNRFEEASNFRRMAFETEWLEKKEKISTWIKNLVPESEKLKRRFGGSTDEEDKPIPPTNSFGILRRSGDFFIHWLYRITSFYGESWSWALGVLLSLILVIFPIIFTQLEFQISPKSIPLEVVVKDCKDVEPELKSVCKIEKRGLFFNEAILHSLSSATFQDVEYRRPISFWAEFWTISEKIFAPLQAALLALAIRRKFMR